MVKDLSSPENYDFFIKELNKRKFSRQLIGLRLSKKITEKELAKKIGWKKKKIRNMEMSADKKLNFGDVLKFISALGFELDLKEMVKY